MRVIFADTSYWIALIDVKDKWHKEVIELSQSLGNISLLTTDEVLSEVLTFFSGYGPRIRKRVSQIVFGLLTDEPHVEVVGQSRESFVTGLLLYEKRPDKSYSLADCVSMQLMRAEGVTEALSSDRHFAQEGFTILLVA
jgi:uncharacterized protein